MVNTSLGYHSCTSMAVKAVVDEVKRRLSTRFNFLPGLPSYFYDFEKGVSPQFLEYYAKIPVSDRQNDWITLAYSYDTSVPSSIQSRRGFNFKRKVTDDIYRCIDIRYNELSIVFSILCNSSKLANAVSNFILQKLDWSFTVKFQDLLWPTWLPNQNMPVGWYIRPSKPNGKLYKCVSSGLTGEVEPRWITVVSQENYDNEVTWECIEPDLLDVKAGKFVKQDSIITNPMERGVMYQYDFGFTLSYVDLDDNGKIIGRITKAMITLLDLYNPDAFREVISVPD